MCGNRNLHLYGFVKVEISVSWSPNVAGPARFIGKYCVAVCLAQRIHTTSEGCSKGF